MTKPKYATAEERKVALAAKARAQMLAQWERRRLETGAPLGYAGCHNRVRKERGRASDYVCEICGKRARHWSHIHNADPTNIQNYRPLCQKCHWAYDQVGANNADPATRSAAAKLMWARRTPERRSEIGQKVWATRRARQEAGE